MIIWVFLRDEIVAIIGVKSGFCCNKIWVKVWQKIDMGLMEFLSIYCWNFGCFGYLRCEWHNLGCRSPILMIFISLESSFNYLERL